MLSDRLQRVFPLLVGLATVLGVVTGVGTIVGWLAAGSDAVEYVLPVAGAVAFVGVGLAFGWTIGDDEDSTLRRVMMRVYGMALGGLIFGLLPVGALVRGQHAALSVIGALVLVLGVGLGAWQAHAQWHRHLATQKTCPDCAETVKAEAHVCRHCGYRFKRFPARQAPTAKRPRRRRAPRSRELS